MGPCTANARRPTVDNNTLAAVFLTYEILPLVITLLLLEQDLE